MTRSATPRMLRVAICIVLGLLAAGWIYKGLSRPVSPVQNDSARTSSTATNADSGALADHTQTSTPASGPTDQPLGDRIQCRDLIGETHGSAMTRLARAAKLPDGAYSRYHETVASAICNGDSNTANGVVDSGYLSYGEAKAMQDAIASEHPVLLRDTRSAEGLRFEEAWKGLRNLGLCSACAADIADFYAKKPTSRCGALATQALDGDDRALDELESEPKFCQPD